MSTFYQLKEGLNEAWETLVDGWQRLYRRAAGAITRFTPGAQGWQRDEAGERQDIAVRSAGWGVLAAEVYDDDDAVFVRIEVPGMEKDDFNIEIQGQYLVVRGEKQVQRERTEGRYHMTECAYGRFERAVPLPDEVESSRASASYGNGVLRVELPKIESGHRRKTKINVN